MDWTAIVLSLQLAACTTLVLCALGLPLAYWLAVSGWRWKFLIEAVVALPLVLPPTVLGFYLLVALSPRGPLGYIASSIGEGAWAFSFGGLVIGSVLYSLPLAVRPFTAALNSVDRRLVEASWCLGVSRTATFFRIVLPLAWPGILTGIVLSFAHTIGEFGVVLMIGADIPGKTRTVSMSIYDNVQALNYSAANQTSMLLLVFAFVVLSATYALPRRSWVV